jgi:hypothetical protein
MVEDAQIPISKSTVDGNLNTPSKRPIKKTAKFFAISLFIILLVLASFWFLKYPKNEEITLPGDDDSDQSRVIPSPVVVNIDGFAQYKETPVNFKPQVPSYRINTDFSNVENAGDFEWLIKQNGKFFRENGFVVTSGWNDEFFPVYEHNRYSYTPNFISSDSVLHTFHLLFNAILEKLEKNVLNLRAAEITSMMLQASESQYQKLKGTEWENAAKRNIAFFSVAGKILDDKFEISSLVKEAVEKELELIGKKEGIAVSPVMALGVYDASGAVINPAAYPDKDTLEALKEDYTQYIPRGHYDKSETMKKYFQAMMWFGRLAFRFKSADEVRSAVLMVNAMEDDNIKTLWKEIDQIVSFFVGKSDDIDYYIFAKIISDVYGQVSDVKDFLENSKFDNLQSKLADTKPPAINSIPIYQADLQADREKEIKGFRFMGQKFTVDASILQKLVCRDVGTKNGSKLCGGAVPGSRMIPNGLDIPAALGSVEAYKLLEEKGETQYLNYPQNMSALKTYLTSLKQDIWTQNLYWSWIYSLLPLVEEKRDGYPFFMQNKAWVRKQLNTLLGSWAELKHDTILYAKQVYAEMGAGMPEQKDDRGYVEPQPGVYARLASLSRMVSEGLSQRNLADDRDKEMFKIMEDLCINLKTISEKELNNEDLTKEEYEFIRGYGGSLEHLYMKAMEDNCRDKDARQCLDDNPAAIVADVATDPNGQVLEVAIGNIHPIYAVVPVDGKLRIAYGGIFSYYEFTHPMDDRLTDSKWRDLLTSENAPKQPDWTSIYRGN